MRGLPTQPLNPKSVADDEDVGLDLPSSQGPDGKQTNSQMGDIGQGSFAKTTLGSWFRGVCPE